MLLCLAIVYFYYFSMPFQIMILLSLQLSRNLIYFYQLSAVLYNLHCDDLVNGKGENNRKLYKMRHNDDRKIANSNGFYADRLLWNILSAPTDNVLSQKTRRYEKLKDNLYHIDGKTFKTLTGTREEVHNGFAYKTGGC